MLRILVVLGAALLAPGAVAEPAFSTPGSGPIGIGSGEGPVGAAPAVPGFAGSAPASAEGACGGADSPCSVAGGIYNIMLPEGPGPFPTVVFFVGSRGTGAETIGYTGFTQAFTRRGYAILVPTPPQILTYVSGETGTGWVWRARGGRTPDFGFIAGVLDDALARFPLDASRVYAAGQSMGGIFLWHLACRGSEPRFKAYATNGGLLYRDDLGDCALKPPIAPMLQTHGTGDEIVTLGGRRAASAEQLQMGVTEMMDMIIRNAVCAQGGRKREGKFDLTIWTDCRTGGSVGYAIYRGGHGPASGWVSLILAWYEGRL